MVGVAGDKLLPYGLGWGGGHAGPFGFAQGKLRHARPTGGGGFGGFGSKLPKQRRGLERGGAGFARYAGYPSPSARDKPTPLG